MPKELEHVDPKIDLICQVEDFQNFSKIPTIPIGLHFHNGEVPAMFDRFGIFQILSEETI